MILLCFGKMLNALQPQQLLQVVYPFFGFLDLLLAYL
jgi:hypothetical protein